MENLALPMKGHVRQLDAACGEGDARVRTSNSVLLYIFKADRLSTGAVCLSLESEREAH